MGNRIALRLSWLLVKAAEYSLPVLWKLLVITFYVLIFFAGFILALIIL